MTALQPARAAPLPRPPSGSSVHTRPAGRNLGFTAGAVLLFSVLGWGGLLLVLGSLGAGAEATGLIGLGATTFLLGARHAFDADHIAVIDNTIRRMVGDGRAAYSVGLWFSLGHSSVVIGLSVLVALGVHAVAGPAMDADSSLQDTLSIIGSLAAGGFLLLVGLGNVPALRGLIHAFRSVRRGTADDAEPERLLASRGVIFRLISRVSGRVRKPWHVFPAGLLMGLSLDTATQVALLVLTGGGATLTLPWYAALVLPILFTAGITLFDSLDALLMVRAYRWALESPTRRISYNLVVTALSVAIAITIGTVIVLQALGERILGDAFAAVSEVDLGGAGYLIAGLFAASWIVSVIVWRRTVRGNKGI